MKIRRVILIASMLAIVAIAAPARAQLPNVLGDLQAERAKYPATISAAQAGELLNAVAARHPGFGLLRKDGGNRCPQPKSGTTVSCDWLVHRPSGLGCDVLVSGPDSDPPANGPATPTWCNGEPFDVSRFVEPTPVDSGGGGDPGGGGQVPPSGDVLAELKLQTELLQKLVIASTVSLVAVACVALLLLSVLPPRTAEQQRALTAETNAQLVALRADVVKATREMGKQLLDLLPLIIRVIKP